MPLVVKNINFSYGNQKVLRNINFEINDGEIMAIIGPNGTGKTTLLKNILMILKGAESIKYGDIDLKKLSIKERSKYISYVPQSIETNFGILVYEYIRLGQQNTPKKQRDEDLDQLFKNFQIEKFAGKMVHQLSGGERQRVIIARALAQNPKVLLLDEPTSALDLKYEKQTMELLKHIAEEKKVTILMTVHDINIASMYADKILILKNTDILSFGVPKNVLTIDNLEKAFETELDIIDYHSRKIVILK